jgi:hypothetical protein
MNMNRKWMGWTLGVLGFFGTLTAANALNFAQGDDGTGSNGIKVVERGEPGAGKAAFAGRHGRRMAAAHFLQKLNLTDAQRALALQQALNTQPIVDQARRDTARILVAAEDARSKGQKVDVREQLKTVRQQTLAKLEPMAQQLIASLTPDQHKMIEDASTKRGQAFDEKRLVRRTAILLSRPMTAAILEARLGR